MESKRIQFFKMSSVFEKFSKHTGGKCVSTVHQLMKQVRTEVTVTRVNNHGRCHTAGADTSLVVVYVGRAKGGGIEATY